MPGPIHVEHKANEANYKLIKLFITLVLCEQGRRIHRVGPLPFPAISNENVCNKFFRFGGVKSI